MRPGRIKAISLVGAVRAVVDRYGNSSRRRCRT
jgi:hypothetical protein